MMIMYWRGRRLEDLSAMELLSAREITQEGLKRARSIYSFHDVDVALAVEFHCQERGWPGVDLTDFLR